MSLNLQSSINHVLEQFHPARMLVGLSGGVDSCVLLHTLVQQYPDIPIEAIHIHHGLNLNADQWQQHCESLCDQLEVPLQVHQVQVLDQGKGIEAAARDQRYQVFERLVHKRDLLCLGHHLDDQVETFFLRLFRGAGPHGLTGMAQDRALGAGRLVRPLLHVGRQQIEDYAIAHKLVWIEDDSNLDTRFDRNLLRQTILPLIEQRWPGYRQNITRTMGLLLQQNQQLRGGLSEELQQRMSPEDHGLDIRSFDDLPVADQAGLIRLWLSESDVALPSEKQLQQILNSIIPARDDAEPVLELNDYQIRRYQQKLWLVPNLPQIAQTDVALLPDTPVHIEGMGTLLLQTVECGETSEELISGRCQPLNVQLRQGGERVHPLGRYGSRDLKRLLQEYHVPPWWRDRLPLLYWQDDLVAVADLFVCEGFQSDPEQTGFRLVWYREGE